MGHNSYKTQFLTGVKTYRKDGAKIISVGTYVDYNSLYLNYQGKMVPTDVIEFLGFLVHKPPKEAKQHGIDVARLTKKENDKQLYVYNNEHAVSRNINIQICDENGNTITTFPCQKYSVNDFVESPLLEKVTPDSALINIKFVSTKENIVAEGTYINIITQKKSTRTIAFNKNGANYDVNYSPYMINSIKEKINIKKEHENAPLLALVSIYGDDFLKPLLKKITPNYSNLYCLY